MFHTIQKRTQRAASLTVIVNYFIDLYNLCTNPSDGRGKLLSFHIFNVNLQIEYQMIS